MRILPLFAFSLTLHAATITAPLLLDERFLSERSSYGYFTGTPLPELSPLEYGYFGVTLSGVAHFDAVNNTASVQYYPYGGGYQIALSISMWEGSTRPCIGCVTFLFGGDGTVEPGESRSVTIPFSRTVQWDLQNPRYGDGEFIPSIHASVSSSKDYIGGQQVSPDWHVSFTNLQGSWAYKTHEYEQARFTSVPEPSMLLLLGLPILWRALMKHHAA